MKRKLLCLLLAALLLLTACVHAAQESEEPDFLFYYPTAESNGLKTALTAKPVSVDEALSAAELVRLYLASEPPEGAKGVLPEQWTLLSVSSAKTTLFLTFGGGTAEPTERSLACAAMTETLLQLSGFDRLSLTLPQTETPLVLTENDVLLEDTAMLPQKETVTLYYPDAERRYLVRETLVAEAMSEDEKPQYIVERLLDVHDDGCFPSGTQLLNITVENGVCTVDLSSQFVTGMNESFLRVRTAVYALVNSLTELPEIDTVDLWVSGAPLEQIYLLELSAGLTRDESLIVGTAEKDAVDATLYPTCGDSGLLVPVPKMLEQGSGAQELLEALIAYQGENGVRGCIPEGTKLLSLHTENGVCTVDLTGEFLDGCANAQEETLAVRSVVATLTSLPEINSVELLIEGITPTYRSGSAAPRSPSQTWFAR